MGTITTRPGYEYGYRFCVDEELLSSHQDRMRKSFRAILLEVRTTFKIKLRNCGGGADDEIILATERFGAALPAEDFLRKKSLEAFMRYRLEEYWMPEDGIRSLVQGAFDFADRLPDDPNYASFHEIPFAVRIDVYTVQLEGEPLAAANDRSISPGCLIPIHVWPFDWFSPNRLTDLDLQSYLLDQLPRTRVENVDQGMALMDVCPICLCGPRVGAHVSILPDCKHAFHNHCLVRWLLKRLSCPLCRFENHFEKEFEVVRL